MRNKVGRFTDAEEKEDLSPPPAINISVGERCEVESTEPGLKKRGAVRFVGQTKFGKGIWIGIEYDEPFGKNDGSQVSYFSGCSGADVQTNSVQGERYFDCQQNYGVFVRPEKVTVGDFPVEAINLDEDEEMQQNNGCYLYHENVLQHRMLPHVHLDPCLCLNLGPGPHFNISISLLIVYKSRIIMKCLEVHVV